MVIILTLVLYTILRRVQAPGEFIRHYQWQGVKVVPGADTFLLGNIFDLREYNRLA